MKYVTKFRFYSFIYMKLGNRMKRVHGGKLMLVSTSFRSKEDDTFTNFSSPWM
jgi:hypothetical protein